MSELGDEQVEGPSQIEYLLRWYGTDQEGRDSHATELAGEFRTPNTVEYIARMIAELGPIDRRQLFEDVLPAVFCMYCGNQKMPEHPRCYCMWDE